MTCADNLIASWAKALNVPNELALLMNQVLTMIDPSYLNGPITQLELLQTLMPYTLTTTELNKVKHWWLEQMRSMPKKQVSVMITMMNKTYAHDSNDDNNNNNSNNTT